MRAFLLSILSVFSTTPAFASGSTDWGKVSEIYVNGGWSMVKAEGIDDNPDSCQQPNYYALNPTQLNYETLHSTLMTALVTGQSVRFWVDGCNGQNNEHPHIASVFVKAPSN